MFTTRQSSNQEIVDYIGLLRSREYVAAFAKQRLSASLTAQLVADIAASFSQGIAYFSSAEQASMQIKPMLQYYGILNLVTMPTDRICRVKEHEREFGVFQQVQRR